MTTIRDILTLALPAGSKVLSVADGLGRQVNWIYVLRGYPPLPEDLNAGDLVLLASSPPLVSEDILGSLIGELAERGVVALIVVGEVPDDAVALASKSDLPLLTLPAGTRPNEVEKAAAALILNFRAELEQRGVQIYRQLAQMVTSGRGIGAIIDKLADITGKTVTMQDQDFKLSFFAGLAIEGFGVEDIQHLLRNDREPLVSWLEGLPLVSTAPPISMFHLPVAGLSRYVAPVIVSEAVQGYISIIANTEELTEMDRVSVGRAASVSAIELTKERAVVQAEYKVRGDFLEALLAGDFLTEESVIRRGALLGYDLTTPYWVAVVKADVAKGADSNLVIGWEYLLRSELVRCCPRALLYVSEDVAHILWPVKNDDVNRCKVAVERLRGYLQKVNGINFSAGLGRIALRGRDFPRSHREANQALGVAQKLLGGGRTAYIDDLLVYRLLFPLQGSQELTGFYEECMGRLVDHDRRHRGELVKTLEAFFASNGNINRTAERLFLHRNAVSYRLKRVERISGLSLDDPEHRLALQLGLKVRDMV